jgi:hypothetical protein
MLVGIFSLVGFLKGCEHFRTVLVKLFIACSPFSVFAGGRLLYAIRGEVGIAIPTSRDWEHPRVVLLMPHLLCGG